MSERLTLEQLRVLRYHGLRDVAACTLPHDESNGRGNYCGKCGWARALADACDTAESALATLAVIGGDVPLLVRMPAHTAVVESDDYLHLPTLERAIEVVKAMPTSLYLQSDVIEALEALRPQPQTPERT